MLFFWPGCGAERVHLELEFNNLDMRALGVDIGGANLKLAAGDHSKIIYFPVWSKYSELENKLGEINEQVNPHKVGVVVTAELADCFNNRSEGIKFISTAVRNAFSCKAFFLSVNGDLQLVENIGDFEQFFANNWTASVKFLLSEGWEDFILADMGSTTTDLIPVTDRVPEGRSDYERLKRGELFYCGALRTPVFHILPQFDVPLVPEYFAISGDAFIVTGDLTSDDYTCETPDGRGKSRKECMVRLARTVCLDIDGNDEYVEELAQAIKEGILERTSGLMKRLASKNGLNRVLGCGIGEFGLQKAALQAGLRYSSLTHYYPHTHLFPAYAVSKLVEKDER